MHYRKKPVIVEAELVATVCEIARLDPALLPTWLRDAYYLNAITVLAPGNGLLVRTLEGVMEAAPTDMLIRGVKGELYPCKPDIFDATYEVVL